MARMSEEQLRHFLAVGRYTPDAERTIRRIRDEVASRKVQGNFSNVTGRYPSKKMGFPIQFESRNVELPFVHEYERDDDVIEFYDQPFPIKLSWESLNLQRIVSYFTTPDFFIIRRDGTAGWEECKPEEKLVELAKKSRRFVQMADGSWSSPAGEEYAASLGLYYRVRTSAEIDYTVLRNISYLFEYMRDDKTEIPEETVCRVKSIVAAFQGITLSELYAKLEGYNEEPQFQ